MTTQALHARLALLERMQAQLDGSYQAQVLLAMLQIQGELLTELWTLQTRLETALETLVPPPNAKDTP